MRQDTDNNYNQDSYENRPDLETTHKAYAFFQILNHTETIAISQYRLSTITRGPRGDHLL